jgi:hypothetical protein
MSSNQIFKSINLPINQSKKYAKGREGGILLA